MKARSESVFKTWPNSLPPVCPKAEVDKLL